MPANKLAIADRQKKVIQAKLENPSLTTRQLGEMFGVSPMQISRDIKESLQNVTIKEQVDFLKAMSLGNATNGTVVESRYIDQVSERDEIKDCEAQVVSQMTEKNQKRYSVIAGANTDDQGGEKEHKFTIVE